MRAGGVVTLAAFTKYCAVGNQLGGAFCLSGLYTTETEDAGYTTD